MTRYASERVELELNADRLTWCLVIDAIHAYLDAQGGSMNSEIGLELEGFSRLVEREIGRAYCVTCGRFVDVEGHDAGHVLG